MADLPTRQWKMSDPHLYVFDTGDGLKTKAMKVIEEAAEVYGAFQAYDGAEDDKHTTWMDMLYECADVIQATINFAYSIGANEDDLMIAINNVNKSNRKRGRLII